MKKTDMIWIAVAIVIDQMSKMVIETFIELGDSLKIIDGFFSLTYVRNTGAAFSILEGKMWFFYIITAIAVIYLIRSFKDVKKENVLLRVGLVLMIAGGLGNFIDRVMFQYVRDFLDFTIFGYDFAIFNIADTFLCIGVLLALIEMFLEEKRVKLNGKS